MTNEPSTLKEMRELSQGRGLTEIAVSVASTAMGCFERPSKEQETDIAILKAAIRLWEPTHQRSNPIKMRFDATVKALICLAVELAMEKTNAKYDTKRQSVFK